MIEFFLKRRVLTTLATFFIMVVGGYNFFHVRREAFPEISFDWVTVTTNVPGASPQEVDKLVTTPIEDQLRGVSGVDRVESISSENQSSIFVRLDEELAQRQLDRAINDIEQAVGRVTDLPQEADRPVVQELTSDRPLISLSVAGGAEEVRRDFAEELADVLEDIKGVSRVDQEGKNDREIWVEVDREKLARASLSLAEVTQQIRGRNFDMSAGVIEMGPQEVWVRVLGEAQNAQDIGNIILRGNDERSYLKIRDVAVVTERFEEPRVHYHVNGQTAINLNVRKLKSGDTIDLADAVRKTKADHDLHAREKGLELVVSDDVSFFIKRRLRVMTNNLVQGGVLILLALFLFLDWRLALVAAWGVPISFAAAFMVAVPFGFTINLMSLMAFIIVLGMLDDDSVVVAESIYRHLEMGKAPEKAAVDGAQEVMVPVLASVTASCCAFMPFAMMSGIMGKFLFMIPVIVVLTFLASVFEAFFILPAHVVDLMPWGRPVTQNQKSWFDHVVRYYRRTLSWVLAHRLAFFFILFGFLGLTALVAKARLKLILFPPGLIDQFFIQVDTPEGSGLTETQRVFQRVEDVVRQLPPTELECVRSTIGLKGFEEGTRAGTHYAQARVFLTPEENRARKSKAVDGPPPRKTKEILADLRQKLQDLPGAERVIFEELHPGPPVGKAVQVRVRGRDLKVLDAIVERVKTELSALKGVIDIHDSREGGKKELQLRLLDKEAAFSGLDLARVSQNLLFAVGGVEASTLRWPTEEVKVRVRLLPDQRANPQDLLGVNALNVQGQAVPLHEVARFDKAQGLPFLHRYNFRPAVTVSADVDLETITSREANERLQKALAGIPKEYPGYELIFGGEEEETQRSLRSLFRAFGFAILLDFVILAAVFRSYIQPFLILLTIPIGFIGVIYALLLHGKPASFMALLGVVAMTGVIINNAIVLVNFINTKREEGLDAKTACVEAGAVRLRAIWASSITTLLGLFPTAYGFGGFEPFVAPMALSLAWGLTIAMPLALYIIPVVYVLADDAGSRLRRLFTRPR